MCNACWKCPGLNNDPWFPLNASIYPREAWREEHADALSSPTPSMSQVCIWSHRACCCWKRGCFLPPDTHSPALWGELYTTFGGSPTLSDMQLWSYDLLKWFAKLLARNPHQQEQDPVRLPQEGCGGGGGERRGFRVMSVSVSQGHGGLDWLGIRAQLQFL